jgi:hypothetical protein
MNERIFEINKVFQEEASQLAEVSSGEAVVIAPGFQSTSPVRSASFVVDVLIVHRYYG